jgi:zinc transport system substrate-binding protein
MDEKKGMRKNYISIICLFLLNIQFAYHVYAKPIEKINLFVSIPPQKYLLERVGGDRVNVSVMVGPGQNPATYEPTPKQMVRLADADAYFRIGVPFENVWIDVISAVSDSLRIIKCCESIIDRDLVGHTHDQNGTSQIHDPHVWTSPVKAMDIAKIIYDELMTIDPQAKEYYLANYNNLIADLNTLDRYIRNQIKEVNSRYFIVSHPSWGYYADAYGLVQIAIEQKGKEIQAKALVDLVRFARMEMINTIFVQKQFNHVSAEILASEIGAMVQEIDPLAENYIENLYFVTDIIIKELK